MLMVMRNSSSAFFNVFVLIAFSMLFVIMALVYTEY